MFKTISIAAVLIGFAVTLSAQVSPYPDTFKVNYFSNANTAGCLDGSLRITNVGTQVGSKTDPSGNLCALIYVFDPQQELSECCGCKITPDGLLTLSVDYDLTHNTLTNVPLVTGDVKIVSSTSCSPTKPAPATGIRAWMTHVQNFAYGVPFQTETESSDSNLSTGELNGLAARCAAIQLDGSGYGKCTCGNIE